MGKQIGFKKLQIQHKDAIIIYGYDQEGIRYFLLHHQLFLSTIDAWRIIEYLTGKFKF